jgi:hypothetical protein
MQRLPNVHPSDTVKFPSGRGSFFVSAANEGSKILLYNGTQLTLQLDFLNGKSDTLHPWEANYWTLDGDTKEIQWNIDSDSLNVSTPPISAVFLTLYDASEQVSGTYPVSLFYQTSLGGGTTSTSVASTNTVSNESNPINTLFIDGGPTGNLNMINIYNDHFIWSVVQGGVAHQVLKGNITGNPLQIGQVGDNAEVLGGLFVDAALSVTGIASVGVVNATNLNASTNVSTNQYNDGSGNSVLAITPGSVTRLQTNTGGTIAFQINGGNQATISAAAGMVVSNPVGANGFSLNSGSFNYGMYVGSVSRISTGTYSSTTGAKTVNHGLGAAPTNVMITGGTSTGTATSGADTYGATTFTVIDGAIGVTQRFRAERA